MATIFEDNFNSYNDGDLNGQGSWSGNSTFKIQGTTVKEGTKAVYWDGSVADATIHKTGTTVADGRITFYLRAGQTNKRGLVYIREGTDNKFWVGFYDDGYIKYSGSSGDTNFGTYSANQWYEFEVEWRSSDKKFRLRVNGGTWTDWFLPFYGGFSSGVNDFLLHTQNPAGEIWVDYIAEEPYSPPFLSGWSKRKKITIDSSKIDSDLTHFPVAVILDGDTDFFGELTSDTDKKKVAFTKADGTTQLYAEIEQFDATNQKAVYWVSKSDWTISSSSDTEFYIYYDSSQSDNTTYIGDTKGSTPASNVWDSNFLRVYHLTDEKDSSSNTEHGTRKSATEPSQVDGKIGKALQGDNDDDYLYASPLNFGYNSVFTVEGWVKTTSNSVLFMCGCDSSHTNEMGWTLQAKGNGETSFCVARYAGSWYNTFLSHSAIDGNWHYLVGVYDAGSMKLYFDGTLEDTNTYSDSSASTGNQNLVFGKWSVNNSYIPFGNLTLDEHRISNIARSAAWIKASYNSANNSLLTFGSEETGTASVKIEKSLKYCITKELEAITKSLKYCVIATPTKKTKSLKYDIFLGSTKIEKSLGYEVVKETKVQKGLIYKVKAGVKIEKSLKYTTITTPAKLEKSLAYYILTVPSATQKSLKYCVLTDTKIEKDLIYKALPAIAINKSLKYALTTTPAKIEKSLKYVVNPAPPQEILSGKAVVASASTTATTPEDIDGLSFDITLKNEGYIMAFMSLTGNIGGSDGKKGFFIININGVDSPATERHFFANKDGSVGVVFRSGLLPAGQYTVKGRHYTEAGVTLESKNITLVAFPTEDKGGNRIKSVYDTIVSDSVVGDTVEDIDGLTQDMTTEVLSFIFAMITGSVSVDVAGKLYRIILRVNGRDFEIKRTLEEVGDVGSVAIAGRTELPETEAVNIKGRHATEAGVTGTIAPANLVGLALSTKSGGTGYVIPSGEVFIKGAVISTTSTTLEDIPAVETEVTLTQEAHIFAVMTLEMESEKDNRDNFFAININGTDFEEIGRTSNRKSDRAVVTVVARTNSKLPAGTYTIKGRWRTTSGNTLRIVDDFSLVAIGLETTTQDLPTHLLRGLDYKISSYKKITKDLKYAILTTQTKATKGLIYKIKKAIAITKGLIYAVLPTKSVTKSLKYCISITPSIKTKSLKYNIFLGSTTIQKGLKYSILTTPSAKTKGLIYKVVPSIKVEKELVYKVLPSIAINKSLKYTVLTTPATKTKQLKYNIFLGTTKIEKGLIYDVIATSKLTKSLKYTVLTETKIGKTLKYTILTTPAKIEKDLKYTILTEPSAITKQLKYNIFLGATTIEKQLEYACIPPTKIEKELKYTVITTPEKKTKSLTYSIFLGATAIQKALKYCVIATPEKIAKELIYDILTKTKIEKDLHYEVLLEQAITKSLKYCVITTPEATTKSLKYQIITTPSAIEKTLHYEVLTELAITKSLKYCIINQPSAIIDKELKYTIGGGYPYSSFDSSPYEPFPR